MYFVDTLFTLPHMLETHTFYRVKLEKHLSEEVFYFYSLK